MKYLFVLSLVFLATSSLAEETTTTSEGTSSTEPITSSSLPTTSSTTSPPVTTSTDPTTTPEPTKTTTEIPTSPTPVPTTTTTTVSPTPTPIPTTTTVSPTPTPTPVPTTTNEPSTTKTPIPVPEEGSWNITSGNTTCIRANLKILFKITTVDKEEYIALAPTVSSAKSNCELSNVSQSLVLTGSSYELTMIFEKTSGDVSVRNISFSYMLPRSTSETVRNDTEMFKVKAGNSYLCTASEDIILANVTMEVFSIKLQAFGAEGNTDFGTAEECEDDNKVNDIVPIAVGVALLALVVVVLIAYLVGRRRSRQKGYQSV